MSLWEQSCARNVDIVLGFHLFGIITILIEIIIIVNTIYPAVRPSIARISLWLFDWLHEFMANDCAVDNDDACCKRKLCKYWFDYYDDVWSCTRINDECSIPTVCRIQQTSFQRKKILDIQLSSYLTNFR